MNTASFGGRERQRVSHLPTWWSPKGDKMQVTSRDIKKGTLEISNGNVAKLRIRSLTGQKWRVSWTIHQVSGQVFGYFHADRQMLEVAFLVTIIVPEKMQNESRFEGQAFVQGSFIRCGRWLNIPHPGTGSQGDPNISIFVSNEMRDAVEDYLSS